ncbi:MAG: TonB-dependent receptor [Gemmatimonadetes bacterium]|nr:TonB-dependent receptor [Gemmatimonadota bacterium]
MRLASRVGVVVPILALLNTLPLAAQTGTISGSVTDSAGNPLAGAVIRVEGLFLSATSNANGRYRLTAVPAGTHTLRVRLLGYQASSRNVTVGPGEVVESNFTLEQAPLLLAPIDVLVGSRARHTAADELAVPVDVYTAEDLVLQGTTETSQILQALSPSINFPRQSVTDATDIVRPFTLRGLSPDHTLVLINGWRRHQTALVNTFAYGTGAGSSGVDLNAIPASAIDRVEVLRDGAAAQYGSDAIAGVVNIILKEGQFAPFVNGAVGRYTPDDFDDDGTIVNVSGGWGIGLGRGSLGLFAEFLDRQPTNRAFADRFETSVTGQEDVIDDKGQVVVKRNPVPQPNHHWGDGLEKDVLTMANLRLPLTETGRTEIYGFGGYSYREGTGNGFRRSRDSGRNWPEIYPLGFLPEFNPDVTDYSAAGGFRAIAGGWSVDIGASFGHNDFEYDLRNTLNVSLGPCLDPGAPCAPGDDGILGNADDPGIPNKTSFSAGQVEREELGAGVNAATALDLGLPAPVNLAVGASFRRERYEITQGEVASWVDGGHPDQFGDDAPGGSQVFPGFNPSDEVNDDRTNFGLYAELETNLTPQFLANVAGRFESYSDFGELVTGKLAFRYQPSEELTLRAAGSTGFRAPGISQIHFSKVITNVIEGEFVEIGVFPVDHPASRLLGSQPLDEETSVNLSAGFAVTPRENLNITADYFYVKIDDRILLGATFDDDTTLAILARGGFTTIGGVQYFTNGLDTRTQGVDVTANLRVPVGLAGTLDLTGVVNYTKNEITRVDPVPDVLRNSAETGLIDTVTAVAIEDERPDWRWTAAAEYSVGRFHSLGRASYFGEFESAQPGFCDLCRESYGAKTVFDAEVGYRFGQVDLAIGVRNLFDTFPDQPSSQVVVDPDGSTAKDFNDNFGTFPWAAASPFGYNGRYIYTRASIQLSR